MTDRFPLIFDTADKKIKEIPSGDNLSLIGSDITGVSAISSNTITAGSLNTDSLLVDGQSLGAVAFSNNYDDLDNTPVGFSGSYNDLRNLPTIPSSTRQLTDIEDQEPNDKDILQYDSVDGKFIPVPLDIDLSEYTIGDLGNVIITGTITNKFLKFTAGAWRPATIQYEDVQNTPTAVSAFSNDLNYVTKQDLESGIEITPTGDLTGSVFSDDSTLLVDGVNGVIPYSVLDDAPTALSDFSNDLDYAVIVGTAIQNNGLPVLPTQTLDISGSVFGDDSTALVDGVNSTLPYTATESDWAGDAPKTVYEALDRIAAALTALGQQA